MSLIRYDVLIACLLAAATPAWAQESATDLVGKLPDSANAVTIVRVSQILQSTLAKEKDLEERQLDRYLRGESSIPPWVKILVSGALVRPSVPAADWSAALAVVPTDVSLKTISGTSDALTEMIEGNRSAESSRGALFLELSPGLIGIMSPPYRQDAARWCREMAAGDVSTISPYLLHAAENPAQIVMAIDLKDLPNPINVQRRLGADEKLSNQATLRVKVATQIAGIQGATLAVSLTDEIQGELRLDFKSDVSGQTEILHRVLLSVLSDLGLGIDEFVTAKPTAEGTAFVLKSTLSEASLRRIMSLVSTPHPEPSEVVEPSVTPSGEKKFRNPIVSVGPVNIRPRNATPQQATERYLSTVNEMLDDLRASSERGQDYVRTATWHESFARRIGNLSTKGVDPDVQAYGTSIAGQLRALAASLRGQGVRVTADQKSLTYDYQYNSGGVQPIAWGVFGPVAPHVDVLGSNMEDVRQRQAQAVIAGGDQRIAIWKEIGDERADIELKMRKRFGDSFGRKK
ncbi:MAG: hypothetical protein ACK5Q5_19550 [Planctomycetaceae bacterium]